MTKAANPYFSIIIPTFNSGATLVRCLKSIRTQLFADFEVVCVDNLSSDDTIQILSEYQTADTRFRYISEPDEGIYDAMNKGVKSSRGQWVYFLGSDDTLFDPGVLNVMADETRRNPGTEVFYGNVLMRGQNQWNLDNIIFDGEYDTGKFVNRNICHQAIFYKKSIFGRVGLFNLKYITNADFDFNLRCYAATKFYFIDLIIANFFVGGHSTHVSDPVFHKDRGALLLAYFGSRIYTREFIDCRLYIQQAALAKESPLDVFERSYCLLAYLKLKYMSIVTPKRV